MLASPGGQTCNGTNHLLELTDSLEAEPRQWPFPAWPAIWVLLRTCGLEQSAIGWYCTVRSTSSCRPPHQTNRDAVDRCMPECLPAETRIEGFVLWCEKIYLVESETTGFGDCGQCEF